MDHLLDDGTVPGWPIRCLVCGRSWRRGPRGSQCHGDAVGTRLAISTLDEPRTEGSGTTSTSATS